MLRCRVYPEWTLWCSLWYLSNLIVWGHLHPLVFYSSWHWVIHNPGNNLFIKLGVRVLRSLVTIDDGKVFPFLTLMMILSSWSCNIYFNNYNNINKCKIHSSKRRSPRTSKEINLEKILKEPNNKKMRSIIKMRKSPNRKCQYPYQIWMMKEETKLTK